MALRARARNPRVTYTIFLGTGGPIDEETVAAARRALKEAGQANRFTRFFGPKIDACLQGLDEVIAGKGDGAIAVARGRLQGVGDTVVLPFNHVDMMDAPGAEGGDRLRKEILKRLAATSRAVASPEAPAPAP